MLYSNYVNNGFWSLKPLIHHPIAVTEKAILVNCHSSYKLDMYQTWIPLSACIIVKDENNNYAKYYLIKDWYIATLKKDKIFIKYDKR